MTKIPIEHLVRRPDVNVLLRYYRETNGLRFALLCETCKALCAIRVADCECCRNIGRSFSGSKRVRTMSPHELLPIGPLLNALASAAAA